MSTKLQVVVSNDEMARLRRIAASEQTTVSQWVRRTLQAAEREYPLSDADKKIMIVREAVSHSYPAGEVDEMLRDIDAGARGDVQR